MYKSLLAAFILFLSVGFAQAQYNPIPNFSGANAGQQFRGALNNKLSGSDTVAPRIVSLSFAQLSAIPALNGQMYYINDATQTIPCAGGGSGAFAVAVAGIWSCAGGGGGAGLATLSPVIGSGQTTFTTTPALTATALVFFNGVLLKQGVQSVGGQYSISANQLIFNANAVPQLDDNVQVVLLH
jgi:hypothetical protein